MLQALGFAGPSYVPTDPASLWVCALHMSDCLFFWDAAADWKVAEVMKGKWPDLRHGSLLLSAV
jgi:hypothetical protein